MYRVHEYPINSYLEAMAADYRRQGKKAEFEPFAYSADYVPLPAAGSLNQVNVTDADSAFACFYQMQSALDSATRNRIFFPDVLVQITQDASGRAMQDRPVHVTNIFGISQRAFPLIRPFVIDPKSSWTTTASNLEAAIAIELRLTYWGVKIYLSPLR